VQHVEHSVDSIVQSVFSMFQMVGSTGIVRAAPSQGLASMADRLIGQHHHEAQENCWHGSGCIAGPRRLRMHDAYFRRVAAGVLPGRRPGVAHGGHVHVSGGVSDLRCGWKWSVARSRPRTTGCSRLPWTVCSRSSARAPKRRPCSGTVGCPSFPASASEFQTRCCGK